MTVETIDVDALMNSIEEPSADRAMSGPEESQPAAAEPAAQPQAETPSWEIDWRGQKVKADSFDKFRQWAQQGYDYSQRVADLKRQQQEFESKYKGFDRYAEVDEYAKQNKEWWNHVEQAWQTRDQYRASQQGQEAIAPLLSELNEVKSFVSELKQERTQEQIRQQDEALNGEIKSIQEKYPDLDLNAVDESGYSLEYRILKHAAQIGTHSFRAAFNDYYHDQLTQMAAAKAKSDLAKEQHVNAKKGLLGKSPTPMKAVNRAENVRGKSYDSLTQEALAEFGII